MFEVAIPKSFLIPKYVGKGKYHATALYFLIAKSAPNGAIHNYESVLQIIGKRYNVSVKTLKNYIVKLKNRGWLRIDKDRLVITSWRIILANDGEVLVSGRQGKKRKRSKLQIFKFKDYKSLKFLIKAKCLAIHESSMNYMVKKDETKLKKACAKKTAHTRAAFEGSSPINRGWSRRGMSEFMGFKSRSSATGLIREAVKYKICTDTIQEPEVMKHDAYKADLLRYKKLDGGRTYRLIRKNGETKRTLVALKANIVKFTQDKKW